MVAFSLLIRSGGNPSLFHAATAASSVNIEIASGVVDLLLDLSEEVFSTSQTQAGNKLTKAQWREFTDIFAQGKKVSLRNVVKKVVSAEDNGEEMEGMLKVDSSTQPYQILAKYRNEPSLLDLQEFMTSSGMFNLAQINKNLYFRVSEEYSIPIDSQDGSLKQNPAIGEQIERIQGELIQGSTAQMKIYDSKGSQVTLEGKKSTGLPSDLPLKLSILGRTFSGKKTIAKQI